MEHELRAVAGATLGSGSFLAASKGDTSGILEVGRGQMVIFPGVFSIIYGMHFKCIQESITGDTRQEEHVWSQPFHNTALAAVNNKNNTPCPPPSTVSPHIHTNSLHRHRRSSCAITSTPPSAGQHFLDSHARSLALAVGSAGADALPRPFGIVTPFAER